MRAHGALRLLVFTVALASLGARCGGAPPKVPRVERTSPPATEVTDEAFAEAMRDLLATDPATEERSVRLRGVLARHVTRTRARFEVGSTERGLASVQGALVMVRSGKLAKDTLGKDAPAALMAAAKEYAGRGDEGRSRALYEIVARDETDPAARQRASEHLRALDEWQKSPPTGRPMIVAAQLEKIAIGRRVFEPSEASAEQAVEAVKTSLRAALQIQKTIRTRKDLTFEEVQEARRVIGAAPITVALVYLRDADAPKALGALEKAGLRGQVREDLARALEKVVAAEADAQSWLELLRALAPGEGGEEEAPDRELLRAAAFVVASEVHRRDPTLIEGALVVADGLQAYGMAEASPAVLIEAVRAHPEPRVVSAALQVTLRSMVGEAEAQDPEASRRAFAAAKPLLAIADGVKQAQPSPSRVRATMGEIELREGRLPQAHALLLEAAKTEASGATLLSLARIERHQKDTKAALAHLQQAMQANDTAQSAALRGEVLLMTSDIAREAGDLSGARTPLTEALKQLAASRTTAAPDDRARVERVLGQVLARFGAAKPAQRAFERALDAAPRDKAQATATLGVAIAEAFVRGDLAAAREGLSRSLAAEIDDADLVYHALWVRLLERQLKQKSSGLAERALSGIREDGRWAGKLAAFGVGRLKADDLVRAAKTEIQKTEATFYAAMDRRAAGDTKASEEGLRQVMQSSGVDLIETQMARALLEGASASLGPPPPNLPIP